MLCLPEFRYFADYNMTAYVDDTIWWKFYLIPNYPSIRRDVNQNPVFLLIKYAFSDDDREKDPNLPKGGGYLAFDVELAIPPADYAGIQKELQKYINEEWNRRKVDAESAGKNVEGWRQSSWYYVDGKQRTNTLSVSDLKLGLHDDAPVAPPGDKPPTVLIGNPTWKDGTFKVLAPQTAQLISNRVTEGVASLVGTNVVSANIDLTPAGATFMEKTLVDTVGTGEGAADSVPIQVVYNLKFLARVPPVTLTVDADSRNLYMSLREIYHDYDEHGCSENDMTHVDTQMETAVSSGLIKIKIDTGMLDLKDDFVKELQQSAVTIIQNKIMENFFEKKTKPENKDDTGKFLDSKEDIYYLKMVNNFESTSFHYSMTLTVATEWKVNPQGMMQTFFAGMSAQDIKKYVRVVDLDDDFFKSLGLKVRVFADWDSEPIAFVECQIRYEGRDENNQQVEKVETFTFDKQTTSGVWDPSLIGNKREYSYRWRVGFKGHEPGEFTKWEKDRSPNLNIAIADPGKVAIDVIAGSIDFAQVTNQVQVELSYKDPASGVTEESMTLVLADGLLDRKYERYIYKEWDRPVRYRTTFFLKEGQRIEGDWQETLNRQLLINEPFVDKLDVQLVPADNWNGVVQSVISLRYGDAANGHTTDAAFSIKKPDEFKSWFVVLRDKTYRKFQYKVLTMFQNGTFKDGAWTDADGDQAIPIIVQQTPYLNVKVLPNLLDFKVTPVVECTLHYDDNAANIHEVETFTFINGDVQSWSFPIASSALNKYRHQLTYHLSDGRSITTTDTVTDVEAFTINKPNVPEIVCNVTPKLINFSDTPLVEVSISYQDDQNDIEAEETLVFGDATSQTFRIPIHDNSPKDYQVTITYYKGDGKVVEGQPTITNKKQLIVPKFFVS
jgi:hypothetical protein